MFISFLIYCFLCFSSMCILECARKNVRRVSFSILLSQPSFPKPRKQCFHEKFRCVCILLWSLINLIKLFNVCIYISICIPRLIIQFLLFSLIERALSTRDTTLVSAMNLEEKNHYTDTSEMRIIE